MPGHRVVITISPNGDTKVGVSGVKGAGCKQLTREFEQALGRAGESKETQEYYEQPLVQTVDRTGR